MGACLAMSSSKDMDAMIANVSKPQESEVHLPEIPSDLRMYKQTSEEVYNNNSGRDSLRIFLELFEKDSVWIGICEFPTDHTRISLGLLVLQPPDVDGKLIMERTTHIQSRETTQVENVCVFRDEESDQLVFEYSEETPDGLRLTLTCKGREEENQVNLKRGYIRGIACKQSVKGNESPLLGTFDFVRTHVKEHERKGVSHRQLPAMDTPQAENIDVPKIEDTCSSVVIAGRMDRFKKQFKMEMKTGVSTAWCPASWANHGNTPASSPLPPKDVIIR